METKTIELDGKTYEIRLVEPQQKTQSEPTLPTLQEVFNKVQPKWYMSELNNVEDGIYCENDTDFHNNLSTERQCKRIQALIALQNIADYYNGEVDYRGRGFAVSKHNDLDIVSVVEVVLDFSTPIFKERSSANLAIEILRNSNLLENL